MGFLNVLEKIGLVEVTPDEPGKDVQQVVQTNIVQNNIVQPNVVQSNVVQNNMSQQVTVDELNKFIAHFDEIFDKANLPGPDYYEFVKMSQAMVNLTDEVKIPAVFSALKVQGLSKEKLLETAKQYIQIIEEDQKKFAAALDTKILTEINNRKNNLVERQNTIKQKEELIKQLQTEIVQENLDIVRITGEIATDEKKFSDKTYAYNTACQNKKNEINIDIEKITKLL